MGVIGSKHKEIVGIDIQPWPRKPVANMKAMRVHDRTIIGVGPSGAVYCTDMQRRVYYSFPWTGSEAILLALMKLGRIPEAVYEAHVREQKAVLDRQDAAWSACQLLLNAERSGLKLTAVQQRRLKATMEQCPRAKHEYAETTARRAKIVPVTADDMKQKR